MTTLITPIPEQELILQSAEMELAYCGVGCGTGKTELCYMWSLQSPGDAVLVFRSLYARDSMRDLFLKRHPDAKFSPSRQRLLIHDKSFQFLLSKQLDDVPLNLRFLDVSRVCFDNADRMPTDIAPCKFFLYGKSIPCLVTVSDDSTLQKLHMSRKHFLVVANA